MGNSCHFRSSTTLREVTKTNQLRTKTNQSTESRKNSDDSSSTVSSNSYNNVHTSLISPTTPTTPEEHGSCRSRYSRIETNYARTPTGVLTPLPDGIPIFFTYV